MRFDFGADSRSQAGLLEEALKEGKGHTCFLFDCFDSGCVIVWKSVTIYYCDVYLSGCHLAIRGRVKKVVVNKTTEKIGVESKRIGLDWRIIAIQSSQ